MSGPDVAGWTRSREADLTHYLALSDIRWAVSGACHCHEQSLVQVLWAVITLPVL